MRLEYAGKSDIGKVRKINQDAFGIFQHEDTGLFVVADGMGGYVNGEKASQTVIAEFSNWWNSFSPVLFEYEFQRMLSSIEQVIEYANDVIYAQYNKNEICGTTVVVLFVYQNYYGVLHAGDSRCYMAQGRKWKVLTVDDVWENQTCISRQERMMLNHPNRGKLVNAIGIHKNVQCRVITDVIKNDIVFLLCSDGLYKFCQDKDLKKCARKCKDKKKMEQQLESLINMVYDNEAKDNITAILVKCSDRP